MSFDPEGVAHCQSALLHRGGGERREPDHIADGVNIGDSSAIVLVDLQPAAAVGREAGFRKLQLAGRTGAADRLACLFGNDRAILVQGNQGPAQIVRLGHRGTPSMWSGFP